MDRVLKAPGFWDGRDAASTVLRRALAPLSAAYGAAGSLRAAWRRATPVDAHIICIGAASVGGSGKTPVTIALARALREAGHDPAILCRGHGGALPGPTRVDLDRHAAGHVGDEALLSARTAPTFAARRRDHAARMAVEAGHRLLIMDDGLTHPHLRPTRALLVADGGETLDTARVLPAGPLREPLSRTIARVDAALVLGEGPAHHALERRLGPERVFQGVLKPSGQPPPGPLVAFAGLGRPEKFFAGLRAAGGTLAATRSFPDHHPFDRKDLSALRALAHSLEARLITTEKDAVRLAPMDRRDVAVMPVDAVIEGLARLLSLLMAPR